MSEFLNLADMRTCTVSEGPGKRFAIWSQGCKQRCPDCCNPEMQPIEKRHIVAVEDLFLLVKDSVSVFGIEGVSLIGGEPFLQSAGMATFASLCQEEGLSVLVFTGYTLDFLKKSGNPCHLRFLDHIDILVDGPYLRKHPDLQRGWVGSSNQQVHFLTNRYCPGIEYAASQSVEISISESSILVNGWPFV